MSPAVRGSILVVHDEKDIRVGLVATLRDAGLHAVGSGAQHAVALWQSALHAGKPFDGVLAQSAVVGVTGLIVLGRDTDRASRRVCASPLDVDAVADLVSHRVLDAERVLLAVRNAVERRALERLVAREGFAVTTSDDDGETQRLVEQRVHAITVTDSPLIAAWVRCFAMDDARVIVLGDESELVGAHAGTVVSLSRPIASHALSAALERVRATPHGTPRERSRPAEADEHVLDRKDLLARLDGDDELALELLRLFAARAPSLARTVTEAVKLRDPDTIRRAAHTLAGALLNISAYRAATAARRIEANPDASDLDIEGGALVALSDALEALHTAIVVYPGY